MEGIAQEVDVYVFLNSIFPLHHNFIERYHFVSSKCEFEHGFSTEFHIPFTP